MFIAKSENNSAFKPVPAGMHLARCYRIIDLGTQKSVWQGVESEKRKIMMQFEIHGEDENGNPILTGKGEPMSISKNYTKSLYKTAPLKTDLQSWGGTNFIIDERQGFDLNRVLGAWAMISVIKELGKDGNEYTNISNINPVLASIKKAGLPEAFNEAKMFDLDSPDMNLFESFGDKLKDKIKSSPEWQRNMKSNPAIRKQSESFDSSKAFDDLESDNSDVPF